MGCTFTLDTFSRLIPAHLPREQEPCLIRDHQFKSSHRNCELSAPTPIQLPVRFRSALSTCSICSPRRTHGGMRLFTGRIHWEASKGTIIGRWQPQAIAPVNVKRRKTFASWLTPLRGWYGRLDRTARLNFSIGAGSNIRASRRNKRWNGDGRLRYILTTSLAYWKYFTKL